MSDMERYNPVYPDAGSNGDGMVSNRYFGEWVKWRDAMEAVAEERGRGRRALEFAEQMNTELSGRVLELELELGAARSSTIVEDRGDLPNVVEAFHRLASAVEDIWPRLRNPDHPHHEQAPVAGRLLRVAVERARAVMPARGSVAMLGGEEITHPVRPQEDQMGFFITTKDLARDGAPKTIERLRENDFKVEVVHKRFWHDGQGDYMLATNREAKDNGYLVVDPMGGTTEVKISDARIADSGWYGVGIADCSLQEPFNRKVGLQIALGRALADMKKIIS